MWTPAASKGYIVVTLHGVGEKWNLRSVILGCRRVEYPHTGTRLADHLLDVVTATDGPLLATIWAITTDNAKNNESMLAVKAGLEDCVFVDTSIGIMRDILKKLADSTSLNEDLQRKYNVLKVGFQQQGRLRY
ncbi:hypothetical protein JG687_00002838 [Phytophthora cactorum]|uniref:Uncharacterized protein n=2 Tax=Phytophthora cactorum TaxID=29920 RepID=A0A8T1UTF2_9STRA|nr:hypothetical protein JG687_00002838 [Phytophthora cactorum]